MTRRKKRQLFEANWAQNLYPERNCGTCKKWLWCRQNEGDPHGYPCLRYRNDIRMTHRFVEVK